jgi:aminoglycoside phosphotransferase
MGPRRLAEKWDGTAVIPRLDPDSAVPQRDVLLDPALVGERLGRLLGRDGPFDVDECRQVRVKYRIGGRLRVVHRISLGARSFHVAASTFPTLERAERAFADARYRAVSCGLVRPVALDRELATVFWTFPNDRKIAHLSALAGPAPDLAEFVPNWSRSSLAAYAPEKTATVRCLDTTGRTVAYAKTYAGREGERVARVHNALTRALGPDAPDLRVPRLLAYSARHRTLLVENVDGLPLHSPRARDLRPGYRALGRALARVHDLAPLDRQRFRRADADRVEAAAQLIGFVRSDTAAPARRLAREIARRLDANAEVVSLHGDVNFRNALLENGRVVLIDLDQTAAGPAAAELGSVLASLRYAGAIGLLRPAAVPTLERALLSGYSELRAVPPDPELRTYTAAALLAERCLRVVTRVRPEGLRRLPALLSNAEEALG